MLSQGFDPQALTYGIVSEGSGLCRSETKRKIQNSPTKITSTQSTKSLRVCPSPYSPRDYAYVASPNYRHHSSSQFCDLYFH